MGASQNSSGAVTVLNTIVAESLDFIATRLEKARKTGEDFNTALRLLLVEMIQDFKPVLFDGDNYSLDWLAESERRGLPNLRSTVDCLSVLTEPESVALFGKYGIYTESELHSRQEILSEIYCTTVGIEAATMLKMAQTQILPAVLRYKADLQNVMTSEVQQQTLDEYDAKIDMLIHGIETLKASLQAVKKETSLLARAELYHDKVNSAMYALRVVADYLEGLTDDALWPLPSYLELLFIR